MDSDYQNPAASLLGLTTALQLGKGLQVYAATASPASVTLLSFGSGPTGFLSLDGSGNPQILDTSGNVIAKTPTGHTWSFENAFVQLAGTSYISVYQGVATVGLGVGAQYGLDSRTGLSTADGAAITLYAVPAAGGLFKISASADITVALTAAGTYTVSYTDINGTVRTLVPMNAQTAQGHYTVAPADAVWVKGSTNITAQLTGSFGTTSRCNVYASVVEYQ